MTYRVRHPLGAALAMLLLHCGGSVANGDPPPEIGLCEGTPHGSVPVEHRSTAMTCPRSPDYDPDATPAVTCTTDADCAADGSPAYDDKCVQGVCGADECLVDSDCPASQVCVCAADGFGGDGPRLNVCVPASCKVDSDCGAGRYCAPSRSYCGSVDGYECTSPADTCVDPQTDCSTCGGNTCDYAPQVGHFVCATSVCNG